MIDPVGSSLDMNQDKTNWVVAGLIAVLLIGAVLRFTGLNWDENQHLHPDERFLTMVETAIAWPTGMGEYFDSARSPLNPYNRGYDTFVYGTLPLFLTKAAGDLVKMPGYDGVHLVGRALSALFDLGSVALIFLIGRRLYSNRVGLLAALLLSLSVLNIQQSHFFTVDTFATFFVALFFFFIIQVAENGSLASFLLAGAALGLSLASKISTYPLGGIAVLAAAIYILRLRADPGFKESIVLAAGAIAARLGLLFAVAFLVFRVGQPYAFAGPGFFGLAPSSKFLKDMLFVSQLMSGAIDYPPSHQWAFRAPILFAGKNMVLWGMGLPLGLAAWAGCLLAAADAYKRRHWALLLPLTWVVLIFLYQSTQFVKSIRYFLPIYPFLVLFAAFLVFRAWAFFTGKETGVFRRNRLLALALPAFAASLALAVVIGTALWAFAFTRIYSRPVSRIAASRWIYENVQPGSTVANEHWDDPLPLRVDGKDGGLIYKGLMLELYNEDTVEKLGTLIQQLESADWIFLSSNRLYGSIPRLPMRYPLTAEYYRLLFEGKLGFRLVKTFTSYPNLAWLEINDDSSDEAFTVYDHPKVLIFQKTADFSKEKVRALLGSVSLDNIQRLTPLQASRAKKTLMLSPEEWAAARQGGTWSQLFHQGDLANRVPVLAWWLAAQALGLLAFPLAFTLCSSLRDRGYIFSKSVGLLLVAYLVWIGASLGLAPFTRPVILWSMAFLALASSLAFWAQRREIRAFLQREGLLLLGSEGLFLAAYLVFVGIRLLNPDLWQPWFGGEKPMEFAYLNAIVKSTSFPPYDPFFAGGYINYYYYGLYIVALLVKLTGIVPAVAFNLAVPMLFALAILNAFALVFNLLPGEKRLVAALWGLVGSAFVAVIGNLTVPIQVFAGLWQNGNSSFRSTIPGLQALVLTVTGLWQTLVAGRPLPPFDYWTNATRIIPFTINEFPFFSFLFADLHPHMIGIPFTLLVLGLALNLARPNSGQSQFLTTLKKQDFNRRARRARRDFHFFSAFSAFSAVRKRLGDLFAVESFFTSSSCTSRTTKDENNARRDKLATCPTCYFQPNKEASYLKTGTTVLVYGLALGALACINSWDLPTYLGITLCALAIRQYLSGRGLDLSRLGRWFGAIALVSLGLYLPFFLKFQALYIGVGLVKARTGLEYYLAIHGLFIFVIASFLLLEISRERRNAVLRAVKLFVKRWAYLPRVLVRYRRLVRAPRETYSAGLAGVLALLGLVLLFALGRLYLFALLVPLLALTALLFWRKNLSPEMMFTLLLLFTALLLSLGVEVFYLRDFLQEGDHHRMNTIFKFYIQVWIFFGIASTLALKKWLAYLVRANTVWLRRLWLCVFLILLGSAALYPLWGTMARVNERFPSARPSLGTLDGTAYMALGSYTWGVENRSATIELDYDLEALRWLQDNVQGSPVVLEGNVDYYRGGGMRVAANTGLPTLVGQHQGEQRYGWMVGQREEEVRKIYSDPLFEGILPLLRQDHVSYIYVGQLERLVYPPQGLAKFDAALGKHLDLAYQNPRVKIYQVRD
jgi:uncharacterized membrane protein